MTDRHGCFAYNFTENEDIQAMLKERMQKIDFIEKEKFKTQEVIIF